uniref:Uncharacterized protein n=1 Tax=Picea glauca TaxID=3330 RepID=A0A101LWK4_PICGL|nr:hypothetical protein ABT39_MTgene1332 [Picea glauca]
MMLQCEVINRERYLMLLAGFIPNPHSLYRIQVRIPALG